MGIRFACFECKKPLNIKSELAGKRGVCPQCGTRFRIPEHDTDYAIPVTEVELARTTANSPSEHEGRSAETPPDVTAVQLRATQVSPTATPVAVAPGTSSLLEDAAAIWYVRPPSGGQYGPASGDILRQWIGEGRLTPTTLVWRDGWAQWRAANDVLVEFGAHIKSATRPIATSNAPLAAESRPAAPMRPAELMRPGELSGDPQIGVRKSQITQKRFVIVGTLTAISLTMIGILIFLLQH